jgi:DNA-directed RNA polymerase subunit RPC12/RpoP
MSIIGMDGKPKGSSMDPASMKDIKCENCGSRFFRQVHAFKVVSALLSQTGKEQIMPVPTFRCDDCGFINEEFNVVEGKENK